MIKQLKISVTRQGLMDITELVSATAAEAALELGVSEGLCTLFIQHTSASLLIQENYDPSAKKDLENWFNRLVPEKDPLYTHTLEGDDDMPAHIKSALTPSSLSIPFINGHLALGTWQGVFLWEHRQHSHQRTVLMHLSG